MFGREHMDIRLFEREAFENGDLINDFLQAIRCPHGEAFKRVPPQNVSLDVVCLEYLRRLNKYLPAFVDKRRNMERGYIHAQLAAISIGEKPQLGSEEADEILNQFEASNRDVATRYLNRQDGRLFATSPERSLKNNLVVSDEDMAFKVGAALWRRMRRVR